MQSLWSFLASIRGLGSPKPRAYEALGAVHQFPLLHTLVVIILSYHLLFSDEPILGADTRNVVVLLLLLSTVVLWRVPSRMFGSGPFISTWVLTDTLLVTGVIMLSGGTGSDLYVTFFLIILLAALAPSLKQAIGLVAILCAGYGVILYSQSLETGTVSAGQLLRIPLFLVMAIFYGYSVDMMRAMRREKWNLFTERRRAEDSLRESEARFRSVIEAANDAIIIADEGGTIIGWNAGAQRTFGYHDSEVTGRPLTMLMPEKYRSAHEAGMSRFRATGQGHLMGRTLSLVGLHKNGHEFPAELTLSTWKTEKDVFVSGIVRDVTDRQRAEQEKAKLEAQLRRSQKFEALGLLAGEIAHDFNNLLTVISGYSEMVLANLPSGAPMHAEVEQIQQAGSRAAELTAKLLAFSRRQMLSPRILDINQTIRELEPMLRRLVGDQIGLLFKMDPALGRIKADPIQLEQIVRNLAANARDAMSDGGQLILETSNAQLNGERHHITVPAGRYVMLKVTDTGCGMDAETLSHIFEPFFTTKDVSQGTGLGLSMIYGIVEQSGGTIEVSSEPGRGTVFTVYFPRVEESEAVEEPPPSYNAVVSGQETVVLVEDEDMVRRLLARGLRDHGYRVLEAKDGNEALRECERHGDTIHLLVTNVIMPGMTGSVLAQRLAEMQPGAKVLYMSGYTGKTIDRYKILEGGAPFLQKPFTPDLLVRKVYEVLRLGAAYTDKP